VSGSRGSAEVDLWHVINAENDKDQLAKEKNSCSKVPRVIRRKPKRLGALRSVALYTSFLKPIAESEELEHFNLVESKPMDQLKVTRESFSR
jgi:hypothetical protein